MGMTGPYDGVIGEKGLVVGNLNGMPVRFEPASGDAAYARW
jgi:hypothetical protein